MAKSFMYKGREYNFSQIVPRLAELQNHLPNVLATTALNYFKDSFRRQGWRNLALKRWAPRKNGARPGGAILVKRGHLRNSLRKIIVSWQRTEIGTNLPYAAAHNEGFSGTVNVKAHTRRKVARNRKDDTGNSYGVRAHTRKMNIEQRQFMGNSEMLDKKIDHVLTLAVDTIFNI